ncbi:hypothetical protein [Lewinella sp. LCG006]|uniref:hypothetical protein n=1 Tax=Lewinella sp. LCG006 TaxID=3231911 RepID=UPI00345F7481
MITKRLLNLSIKNIWSKHGTYSDPHQLLITEEAFYLGGGSLDSWMVKMPRFY